jgi:hypothetical protein
MRGGRIISEKKSDRLDKLRKEASMKKAMKELFGDTESESEEEEDKPRALTKEEKNEIKKLKEYIKGRQYDLDHVKDDKFMRKSNAIRNDIETSIREIKVINFKPQLEYDTKRINDAYKRKEITKTERDDLIYDTSRSLSSEYDRYLKNKERETTMKTKEDPEKEIEAYKLRDKVNIDYSHDKIKMSNAEYNDFVNKQKTYIYNNDYDEAIALSNKYLKQTEPPKPAKSVETSKTTKTKSKPIDDEKKQAEAYKIRNEVSDAFGNNKIKMTQTQYNDFWNDTNTLLRNDDYEGVISLANKFLKSPLPAKPVKPVKPPKHVYAPLKEKTIMKGESELVHKKSGKWSVDTKMKISKNLKPVVKRALRKSVVGEIDRNLEKHQIKGGSLNLDYDSSSDEEEVDEYSKVLKHLVSHITDKHERPDNRDFNQAIDLIRHIKTKRNKR